MQRARLVPAWMDALELKLGDRVLEVGAGPGYVSLALAERVGPDGVVYAIDRSTEALDHLAHLQTERRVRQIRRLVADITTLESGHVHAGSALVSMVLHHANDPSGILRNMYRLLPENALLVVAEFDPNGSDNEGPPQAHRLAPEQVRAWCEGAGFAVLGRQQQTPEHYILVVRRGP